MSDSFLPPRLRGSGGLRSSRWAIPAGVGRAPDLNFPEPHSGFLGTGIGPDVNLGLANAFKEVGQGVLGLASLATPWHDGPGFSQVGRGLLSSLAGTFVATPLRVLDALPGPDPGSAFEQAVARVLSWDDTPDDLERYRPKDIFERAGERGLLPALVEDVGNVALVSGGATEAAGLAAKGAELAGATDLASRLAAIHTGMVESPLIQATQHPYKTAFRALRERVLQPALERVNEAHGIRPVGSFAPVDFLASELPDTGVDYDRVRVNMAEHRARARAYEGLPADDPAAHAAYEAFRNEVREQYRHMTEDLGVTVEAVDTDPYASPEDMVKDVRENKRLKVFKTNEGDHPFLTPEENDMFRAVHDAYGHAATGRDFGRHGEEAAFLAHSAMFSDEARPAMASETRGQNSVLIDTGEFGAQKVALLPGDLGDPTAAVEAFQRRARPTVGPGHEMLAAIERRLEARDTVRENLRQTRLADAEKRQALRSPAVQEAVTAAREHLIEAGKLEGIKITRRRASAIIGEEVWSRYTGFKALEDEYLGRGVPESVFKELGLRQEFVPTELRTQGLETAVTKAVQAQLEASAETRRVLEAGRLGDKGLEPTDATEPTLTEKQKRALARANKLLDQAYEKSIARERAAREGYVASLNDKLGRIADQIANTAARMADAIAEFDHSRTWTPKAWRTPEALRASAEAIFERTMEDVSAHGGEWGGASFDPHTGRFIRGGEDTGYAVALVPGTALEVPLAEFGPQHIEQVVRAYQDVYQHPNTVVGTWVEKGKVFIDPSEIVPTLDDALLRGGARQQISIYDVGGDDVVSGILKDRPDIAAQFLGRHQNFSRRAAELRDIADKAGFPKADAHMVLDLLARQAVRAQELGLVDHPDEFFSKYVKRFEFAKRQSRLGALKQIVLDRKAGTPEERTALWREVERTVQDIDRVRGWYHRSHDLVERLFRNQPDVALLDGTKVNPADLMYQIVAITSFQAMPRDNWTRAMVAFQRFDDLPKREFKGLTAALKKVTAGKATLEEAFGLAGQKLDPEHFGGFALYPDPKQYLAELFSGRTIDKWTPEHLADVRRAFDRKPLELDRAKALDFIRTEHPGLIDRIGEDAAVKEFYARQHRAKIITFWDNLRDPANSLGVTMGQQMERLFGVEMPLSGGGDAWIRLSEHVRDMADELTQATGHHFMPHEIQAALWVFAKDEVQRLQLGHFNALAQDAFETIRQGLPLTDDIDPISQWIDEASAPYRSGEQHVVQEQKIMRDGEVAVEPVSYRPGWGASNRAKVIDLFERRRELWHKARIEINASIHGGDLEHAAQNLQSFVDRMTTKAPRNLGLLEDASGADFFDIWMRGEFHTPAFRAAAETLGRLDVKPGELPPLMQAFKDKVLGEFVPMDDGTRGVIRIFKDGNLVTLAHENGHLLRRILTEGQMSAVERAYGIKDGVWEVGHEERFADDFVQYMRRKAGAPKGLESTFARVRQVLAEVWHMVKATFLNRQVHPDLVDVFNDWLDPAEHPMPEGQIPGLPAPVDESGLTLRQRAARTPRLAEPPAGKHEFYNAGRKGERALANLERLAQKHRQLVASQEQITKQVQAVREVLDTGQLPHELLRDEHAAQAAKLIEKVQEKNARPPVARTPARWQPLWNAVLTIEDAAKDNPAMGELFKDLPQTLHDVQELAARHGFDPQHVRDFTPKQVRRLVWGQMRLGRDRDLLHTVEAGTRKSRTGALTRVGGVERSIESFVAASIEATQEARTNHVIGWIETHVARKLPKGEVLPDGWALWDPVRTHLLTGTELSEDAKRALQTTAQDSTIVPAEVVRTLDLWTKDYDHPALRSIRKITDPWRTLVLTFSPGWYVRNLTGNFLLAMTEGVSLKDWKAAWASVRNKDAIGRFADLPELTSDTLAQEAGHPLDDALIPRKLSEARDESGTVRGTYQHVTRAMTRANEVVDEFARAAVYHHGLRLNMTPAQALERAKAALVDYNALSPFERQVVRSVVPFYTWQKGILKLAFQHAMDHPARVSVLMAIGQMQDEYIADRFGVSPEDVPEAYRQMLGDVNARAWNPFADPAELLSPEGITRSMNPFVELGLRKGLGAPEFFPDRQRLGYFGQVQGDVNVPAELEQMLTRSPGARLLEDPGLGTLGVTRPDQAALRSRFLRARRQLRGIPNPETQDAQAGSSFLPPRAA